MTAVYICARKDIRSERFGNRLFFTAQRPRALAFISRSTSAKMLVVLIETWPTQARMVSTIDAGAEKMGGCGGSDGMRSDPSFAHFRHATHGGAWISGHDLVDAKTYQWLGAAIEEHSFRTSPGGDEASQRRGPGSHSGQLRTFPHLPAAPR
jgi:hypothetical protein